MKKKLKIKLIISSIIGILSIGSFKLINNETNITSYPIYYYDNFDDNNKFAKYINGDVYIVNNRDQMNEIDYTENDIIIVDNRNNNDIIIINSYLIKDINIRNQIVDIILHYNEQYPKDKEWYRTKDSLLTEWYVHNLLYSLGLYESHTVDVDFENDEEEKYLVFFLKRNIK